MFGTFSIVNEKKFVFLLPLVHLFVEYWYTWTIQIKEDTSAYNKTP